MIRKFTEYKKLNELDIPILKLEDIITGVNVNKLDTYKKALADHFKTYPDYIDMFDKNKHWFKVHDMSGDIMNNNRVSFNSIIFTEEDLKSIKGNIVKIGINEIYSALPDTLTVFGAIFKVISFVNKDNIKIALESLITLEEVIKIISTITEYQYKIKTGDYHIWTKNN